MSVDSSRASSRDSNHTRTRGRRFLRRWALRSVGPALFVALWLVSDISQVQDLLGRTRTLLMLAAAGINVLIILVKSWRWREIMKVQSIAYGYANAARAFTIACALAAWTPGRIGDFSKAVSVSRDCGVSFGKAASSVIADRLLDLLAVTLVAAVGAFLLGPVAGTVTWCLVALAAVIVWVLFRWTTTVGRTRARSALDRVGLARAGREMGEALAGLEEMVRPSWGRMSATVVPATILGTLLAFLQGYLVAAGLGLTVSFVRLSAALGAASIASLLPLSVSGIGLREATLMLYLSPIGFGLAEILAFSLAFLVVVNGSSAFLGALTHAVWPGSAANLPPAAIGPGGGVDHA